MVIACYILANNIVMYYDKSKCLEIEYCEYTKLGILDERLYFILEEDATRKHNLCVFSHKFIKKEHHASCAACILGHDL